MIYNEREYKITVSELRKMQKAFDDFSGQQESAQAWILKAQKEALQSQIAVLKEQVIEYELLKEGKIKHLEFPNLSNLPKVLITARIASGMSQKDLGVVLNMTAQQIQRYEATNYMGASLKRLIEISELLNVHINDSWESDKNTAGSSIFVWESFKNVSWDKFPLKEMLSRGWLELKDKQSPIESIKEFFSKAAGAEYVTAFHKKKFYGENKPEEYSLLAWQARILGKARTEYEAGHLSTFEYNDNWIPELVGLSLEGDGPVKAKHYLAGKGISLIIERHLQKTYLDGAAMMLDSGNPVVALTLRYDRLDNFWFILMHELGHVFLHLLDSLNMDFFDEEGEDESDEIEKEANQYASNCLIPLDEWDTCLSRFSMTEEAVKIDSDRLGIHPSIIAGKIRRDNNNYYILNDLVGQGSVRKNFGEQ